MASHQSGDKPLSITDAYMHHSVSMSPYCSKHCPSVKITYISWTVLAKPFPSFSEDLYVTFKWCGPLRLIQFILYTA